VPSRSGSSSRELDELLEVVGGEVARAVVDEEDASRLVLVDVDETDGDRPPPELTGG